jgi:hypothetical protein
MPVTPDMVAMTETEAGALGVGGRSGGRRSGFVATSATSTVPVRNTTYTPQTTNGQRSIKSTSANDTAAGTGARTVRLTYYDQDCNGPFTEVLTLNGTSSVNTVAVNICFVEKLEVLSVGAVNGSNAGAIQLWTQINGGGATFASIAANLNRTFYAHHYVPPGSTCYVTQMDVAGKNIAGISGLYSLDPTDDAPPATNVDTTICYGTTSVVVPFYSPIVVQGPAYIFLQVKPDAATASTAYGGFGFFEQAA